MKELIRKGFPEGIEFPEELSMLCDWDSSKEGHVLSGGFELREGDADTMFYYFGGRRADTRLAQFGAGPDGSLYCIWKQDDGRQPIVHLGSEGDSLMVLASDMREFISILAIGYDEIGFEDLSAPPEDEDYVNPRFRNWVESTFGIEIPETAHGIVAKATEDHDDFPRFVESVSE